MAELKEIRDFLQDCKIKKDMWKMGEEQMLQAARFLSIPGLNQEFYLYREQCGRHITGFGDVWYRPTYEAVYFSKSSWKGADIGARAITKLIFESDADENERPLNVEEILAEIPGDMLQYLVEALSERWAVVTFYNSGKETIFTVNYDRSELWEQEGSNSNAIYSAIDEELKALGPYIIVEKGRADRVPNSTTGDYPVPHVGVFWCINEEIVAVKELWDPPRTPSTECFDREAQWKKLPPEVTRGKPFDHYPGGQVEIKDYKATATCHHSLIHAPYPMRIAAQFGIPRGITRFLAYGYSKEYIQRIYRDFE